MLMSKPATLLEPLNMALMRVSGLTKAAQEEAEKNSETGSANADSISN
jgi:hypothetical protein